MPKTTQKNGTPPKQSEVLGLPEDVAAIRAEIRKFFATKDEGGKRIGSYKHGVYAFYDYDNEPIYVGQTEEKLIPTSAAVCDPRHAYAQSGTFV